MNASAANIPIKTDEDIAHMRAAGRLAADVLDYIESFVVVGVTTAQLDALCHEYMSSHGVTPATLNYAPPGHPPYPKATCISVNHQVCHGVPSDERALKDGDILNIDVTVIREGWHGDTGRMFYVGEPPRKAAHLCEIAYQCLWEGIQSVRVGSDLSDIGRAIEKYARAHHYSVVRDFCGHGVGRRFHEPPQVLHFANNRGGRLERNMIFTIEPMINAGRAATKVLADGWTVVTRDRSLSAQWEHTVRVVDAGVEVLTLSKREREKLSIEN